VEGMNLGLVGAVMPQLTLRRGIVGGTADCDWNTRHGVHIIKSFWMFGWVRGGSAVDPAERLDREMCAVVQKLMKGNLNQGNGGNDCRRSCCGGC